MRTLTKAVSCPICRRAASITLYENIDPERGTEGHDIQFTCLDRAHRLTEPEALKLWAADHSRSET